jgi:hypothetical protein
MLHQGFHKSYREIEMILKLQIDDRYRLGSEHPIWDRPLLDQEYKKIEYLSMNLNSAETAEYDNNYEEILSIYHNLANYFLLRDDTWLSDYFFEKCFKIASDNLNDDEKLAEASCNLALAYERQSIISF